MTLAKPAAPRRGDAREALLVAARELFGQHGYAATTIRGIGDHAGVDAALIARYFGSKAALYLATLEEAPTISQDPAAFVRRLILRTGEIGPSPVTRTTLVGASDPALRAPVREVLQRQLVEPLRRHFTDAGVPDADLRAELALAAVLGVALARSAGLLEELAGADAAAVAELTAGMLATLHCDTSHAS